MTPGDIIRSTSDPALAAPLIAKPRLVLNPTTLPTGVTPVVPSKRGRLSTQQLLAEAANSCTPITNYIESKRKRNSLEQSPTEAPEQPPKIIKTVSLEGSGNDDSSDTGEPGMDRIREELRGLTADQETKLRELTDKLNQKLEDDQIAFDKIQQNLGDLKSELQGTKDDLNKRVKALEDNTVKKEEITSLKVHTIPKEEHDRIIQLSNRIDFLEKDNKKTKISIVGLSLSSSDHAQEVNLFLNTTFGVDIPRISTTEYSKRLIVDLFDINVKNLILRQKKTKLSGTKIFIDSDKTAREREIDWNIRSLLKLLKSEKKNPVRKGNIILVDDQVYSWNPVANKMTPQPRSSRSNLVGMESSAPAPKN